VCNKDCRISINFDTLYSCLASVGQDEAICFQITEESMNMTIPHMKVFIISSNDDDEYVFDFKVTLLALTKEDFEIPKIDFESVVTVPSSTLYRVLRCAEKRSECVQICTRMQSPTENYIIMACQSDDAPFVFHMKFQPDAKAWQDRSCLKQEVYSLKYLNLIIRATSLSSFVTIFLAKSNVLAIRYNIGSIGEITFCLAPRFETSDFIPPPIISMASIFDESEEEVEVAEVAEEEEEEVEEEVEDEEDEEVPESPEMKKKRKMLLVDSGQQMKRRRRKRKKPTDKSAKVELAEHKQILRGEEVVVKKKEKLQKVDDNKIHVFKKRRKKTRRTKPHPANTPVDPKCLILSEALAMPDIQHVN
jgi:proliferating cell nuclear antigen